MGRVDPASISSKDRGCHASRPIKRSSALGLSARGRDAFHDALTIECERAGEPLLRLFFFVYITINSARKGRARIFLRGIHRLFQIHSRGFEPMRRFFQVVLIVATACGGGTAPAISGEATAATDIRPAASDPIVAPVKRTAPQMPANLANQSATVAPAKKSDKASGKKAR